MNRPDGWGGPPFAGAQQWGPGAPHPGQPYPGQYPPPGGPRPPYPPHPAPWPGAGQPFAPPPPPRRSGSGRRPLVLVLAGLVVLALLGGGGLLMSGAIGARDQSAPVVPVSAPAANPGPAVPDAPAVE